jgi:phenylalanyl-tRNA synthetase beta chain
LHPGRSAQIILDGKNIGFIGELHPRWQQKYDLPLAPVLFEVDASALQARNIPAYQEISRFPAVTRDLAFVVRQAIPMQELIDTFMVEKETNPICNIVQAIVLFDEYRGKGLEGDEKSLAFRFTLQDTQSTLQDDNVDAAMTAIVAAVNKKHDAKLRT